jgi:hypothetical protein
VKDHRQALADVAEEARLEDELRLTAEREVMWAAEMERAHRRISLWRQTRAEAAEEALQMEREAEAMDLEEYQKQAQLNAQRVAYRQEEWEQKMVAEVRFH